MWKGHVVDLGEQGCTGVWAWLHVGCMHLQTQYGGCIVMTVRVGCMLYSVLYFKLY
jgi:hypothetical protein